MYNECVDKIVSAVFFIIIIIITTIGVNTAMNSDCKKKKCYLDTRLEVSDKSGGLTNKQPIIFLFYESVCIHLLLSSGQSKMRMTLHSQPTPLC